MRVYVPLAEDLTELLRSYETNPLITEAQRRIWRAEGRKKAITHGMLGKDHPKALRLLEEDGYDGKPVGSLKSRSAESFWTYSENHVFPPTDDLIRLGIFMHLDVYSLIALVLKGKWEEFFAREICGWRANVGKELATILQNEKAMEEAMSRFNPDTSELLWRLFHHAGVDLGQRDRLFDDNEVGAPLPELVDKALERARRSGVRWLVDAGYTPESFDTLVQTMLLQRLHWVAINSPELEHFKRKAVEEAVIWNLGTEEEREEYWSLCQSRLQLWAELDDLLLMIEDIRLRNAQVQFRYLQIFGRYELELQELRFRCWELEQKILYKNLHPDSSPEELDQMISDEIKKLREELEKLREEVDGASLVERLERFRQASVQLFGGERVLSEKEQAEYLRKCKEILRKIFLLTHPDTLKNHPAYPKLTPRQKDRLAELFAEAKRIRVRELGYPDGYFEGLHRTPEALQRILDEVQTILANAGLELDPDLLLRLEVKGDTLPERLAWLREKVKEIEGMIQDARAELHSLLEDEEIARKRSILANPEAHEQIKDEMEREIKRYRERARELEAELERLFGGEKC